MAIIEVNSNVSTSMAVVSAPHYRANVYWKNLTAKSTAATEGERAKEDANNTYEFFYERVPGAVNPYAPLGFILAPLDAVFIAIDPSNAFVTRMPGGSPSSAVLPGFQMFGPAIAARVGLLGLEVTGPRYLEARELLEGSLYPDILPSGKWPQRIQFHPYDPFDPLRAFSATATATPTEIVIPPGVTKTKYLMARNTAPAYSGNTPLSPDAIRFQSWNATYPSAHQHFLVPGKLARLYWPQNSKLFVSAENSSFDFYPLTSAEILRFEKDPFGGQPFEPPTIESVMAAIPPNEIGIERSAAILNGRITKTQEAIPLAEAILDALILDGVVEQYDREFRNISGGAPILIPYVRRT